MGTDGGHGSPPRPRHPARVVRRALAIDDDGGSGRGDRVPREGAWWDAWRTRAGVARGAGALLLATVAAALALARPVIEESTRAGRISARISAGGGSIEPSQEVPMQSRDARSMSRLAARALAATTVAGALGGVVADAQAQAVQWKVSDGGNGHWYQSVTSPTAVSWFMARDRSLQAGGHLATLTTTAENAWAHAVTLNTPGSWGAWGGGWEFGPWIGGYRDNPADPQWKWTTGEPWSFTAWHSSQPDSRDQIVISFGGGGPTAATWGDTFPDEPVHAFVVEWDADCNNDGIVDYGQCRDGSLADFNGNNIPDCCEQGVACVVGNYPVQWRVEDGGNGHWYRFMPVNSFGSWSSANDAAVRLGGYLATITGPAELGFVEGLSTCVGCPGWGPSWAIGAFQNRGSPTYAEPAGGWQWVTGESWSWAPWAPGEPNNSGGSEDLLYLHCNVHGFNDGGDPSNGCMAAVFEWSADCNHDGIVDYGQILRGELVDANGNGVPDACEGPTCRDADLFRDGQVNGADLAALLSQWGTTNANTVSDINHDGRVDGFDLGVLLSFWGPCGP